MAHSDVSRLQNFPVSWFATVMGLAGLTIALHRAEAILGWSIHPSPALLALTVAVFATLAGLYLLKLARHPASVKAELSHPVKLNFFPTISIGLILISIALLPHYPGLSQIVWTAGTVLHFGFTLYVLSIWIHHTHFEINHMNPAWFIPIVGNILVPIAGVHHASVEISWFFFSIGLVFWLVLLTIIFNRMFFHQPLPGKLLPTLFILIAPPGVGMVSWLQLNGGEVDAFARILYYSALFLTLMLFTQASRFIKVPFALSWWAYSFPMAAITIATLLMHQSLGLVFLKWLGLILLVVLCLLITGLVIRTAVAVRRWEICVEE
ncbi:SLAC1 anion channel family protein [Marinobacter nauticus]|uniref:Tellurite resistance protein n=1 Tax=Marinobacter nauticus TaxID=2743 RepID=A0A368V769_MARNT|nr:SLAC1 anion channel family protein [Marinobacter nauticus]MCG8521423.1 SLAC1 anion channel family protein [Pseudomonadales bacterium]MBY5937060.1 SLAC1 anion channel family protein [Marinobacter nauticus]MBY5954697.1 SLAC1 anion channel family protein [Marinobacter nauticus]MBY6008081.1 SLAC1 anion channel family protein [Marinobacter nauticus]RBP74983.1 tellurite resistance protein [Marinobacter nauticus]